MGTLLTCLESGAAPLLCFLIAGRGNGVAGDEGLYPRDTELYGFLDDPIHIFPFWDCLGECDLWEWGVLRLGDVEHEVDALAGNGEDFRLGEVSQTIKDGNPLFWPDAEDLGGVFCLVSGKERGLCPVGGREEKAGHGF